LHISILALLSGSFFDVYLLLVLFHLFSRRKVGTTRITHQVVFMCLRHEPTYRQNDKNTLRSHTVVPSDTVSILSPAVNGRGPNIPKTSVTTVQHGTGPAGS